MIISKKKILNNSKINYDNFQKKNFKYNTCKNMGKPRILYKVENNKENEKKEKFEEDKNIKLNDIEHNCTRNNYLNRRVKKLSNKINELEAKSNMDQLKYLFFIVEQEKKIAELEKNFEVKIEKMKELKCFPDLISNKFNQLTEEEKNNLLLKSRNKNEITKKYSFEKDSEFFSRKNHSLIITQSERNEKSRKFQFDKKNSDYNSNKNNKSAFVKNKNETKKSKIILNFSKPMNQLFNKKKFFITHPKLNYVKDSIEKNHFLKLKTKEKLGGKTHLLSNMNLASKSQKKFVNNFSSFINNSMVCFEKIKKH